MNLDPRTVMILIIIGSSLMGGGLLASRGHLWQIRGESRWAQATLMQAAGWALVGPLRGVVPTLVWVVIGHGLLALSLARYLTVLAEFSSRRVHSSPAYGLVVLQSAVLAALVLMGQGAGARTIVIAACSGALMLKSGHLLLSGQGDRPSSHAFTGALFAACGSMLVARCLFELLGALGAVGGMAATESLANDFTYLIFYVTATLLTFGFVLMVGDRYVVEQRQAQDALSKSEARFRTLFAEAPLGSALIESLTGRILEVNPKFAEILGRSMEEMRKVDWMQITHPDDVQADLDKMARLNAGETDGFRMEKRYLRPDGAEVWVDMTVARLNVEDLAHPRHFCMIQDITERRRGEYALRESLRAKEALLKETHHRVKNNLALIASLMRLEAGRSRELETKDTLRDMQARIRSVVLLNETLYRTGSYATVALAGYLAQVARHTFQAQNADAEAVRLVLELEAMDVDTALAIPCGLIVSELITNSLKHAFNFGRRGEVRVSLRLDDHGRVRLSVSDTGSGLPKDFSPQNQRSLGLQLVSDLARQLEGDLDIGPGATFTVNFAPRRRVETIEIPSQARRPAVGPDPLSVVVGV